MRLYIGQQIKVAKEICGFHASTVRGFALFVCGTVSHAKSSHRLEACATCSLCALVQQDRFFTGLFIIPRK